MLKKLRGPVEDADIFRSAAGMIQAFQTDAVGTCIKQVSKMNGHSDTFGVDVWQRILAAVKRAQGSAAKVAPGDQAAESDFAAQI